MSYQDYRHDTRIHPEWLQVEAEMETARRRHALHQRLLVAAIGIAMVAGVIAIGLVSMASSEWIAAADAAMLDEEQPIAP